MKRAYSDEARALPKLWVARLLYQLNCSITELNRTLTEPPDGHPFRLGVHPRPIPPKGAARIFQRIFEGHWPDRGSYKENDFSGTFKLFERVCAHLPDTEEWLMCDLLPAARERVCRIEALHDAIDAHARALSVRRLPATAAHAALLLSGASRWTNLLLAQQMALARAAFPHAVVLVTLLLQEASYYRVSFEESILTVCRDAWTKFLHRPEFLGNPCARLARSAAVHAARRILQYSRSTIAFEPQRRQLMPADAVDCLSPFWSPDPEGLEAATVLSLSAANLVGPGSNAPCFLLTRPRHPSNLEQAHALKILISQITATRLAGIAVDQ